MATRHSLTPVMRRLRRPLVLTWAGLVAERLVRAFWPLWTLLAALAAALMLGFHDLAPVGATWVVLALAATCTVVFTVRGAMAFRWPRRQEAVARMDSDMLKQLVTAADANQASVKSILERNGYAWEELDALAEAPGLTDHPLHGEFETNP